MKKLPKESSWKKQPMHLLLVVITVIHCYQDVHVILWEASSWSTTLWLEFWQELARDNILPSLRWLPTIFRMNTSPARSPPATLATFLFVFLPTALSALLLSSSTSSSRLLPSFSLPLLLLQGSGWASVKHLEKTETVKLNLIEF